MDLDSLKAVWFIHEASKLNPNDPTSNGYGFAASVLVGIIVILLAFIVWKERGRDKNTRALQGERKEYRTEYKDLIRTEFAGIIEALTANIGRIDRDLQDSGSEINALRERVARLEATMDAFLGKPKGRITKT